MKEYGLAFVLGGGGARGALQVGAIRALLEAGITPNILVGTSIGAANAAFLAIKGVNLEGVELLEQVWKTAPAADLMPANYLWLTVRALFQRPATYPAYRIRDFFVAQGLYPELRFREINSIRLYMVAADLAAGRAKVFGDEPEETVLDGVLASTALPPWVSPLHKHGMELIDGGIVSNLPIATAIERGAARIIALDLADPRDLPENGRGFGLFMERLFYTIEHHQLQMELQVAKSSGVEVRHVPLYGKQAVPLWEFRHTSELIDSGFQIMKREMESWKTQSKPGMAQTLKMALKRWLNE